MWLVWLAQNWRWIASGVGTAIAMGTLSFFITTHIVSNIDRVHKRELTQQAYDLRLECAKAVKITEDNNADLETELGALNADYDAVTGSVCNAGDIKLQSSGAHGIGDGAAKAGKPVHKDAVAIGSFLAYAREAETYRLQLRSCQSFVDSIYKLNAR